jgi:hypothetical protein
MLPFEAYYKRPDLIMFKRKELHRGPWPMLALFKDQTVGCLRGKETMFVLCTVQETLLNEDQFVQKKNPRINLLFAIAHFMLADSKSHYSGITCAEKKGFMSELPRMRYMHVMSCGEVM